MYYEEKFIDGVLYWRGTPDGEWQQYTAKQLTTALFSERAKSKYLTEIANEAHEQLELVRKAINQQLGLLRQLGARRH